MDLWFLRGFCGFAEGSLLRCPFLAFLAHGLTAAVRDAFLLRLDVRVKSGFFRFCCFFRGHVQGGLFFVKVLWNVSIKLVLLAWRFFKEVTPRGRWFLFPDDGWRDLFDESRRIVVSAERGDFAGRIELQNAGSAID